jgi:outer membrane protein OmpA-like peptidoglycan-associated protein
MRKLLLILALISLSINLFAQSEEQTYYNFKQPAVGLYGGINFNNHLVDFPKLPETFDCCTHYTNGKGMGFAIGGIFSMPLTDFLMFDIRLGYFTRNGLITALEHEVLNLNGSAVDGIFEHSIDAGLGAVTLEPLFGVKIFGGLKFNLGLQAGYMINKSYILKETLIEPSEGTFENGSRERLLQTGDIQQSQSMIIAPFAGLSYDIPLDANKQWYLTPEAFYYLGITDILNDNPWKINTIHAGLAIKYSPWEPVVPGDDGALVPKKPVYLQGRIRAVGIGADSIEVPVLKFVVEEFLSSELKPLLTYVFFDDNSDALRDRYKKLNPEQTQAFSEKSIANNQTMDIYYNMLNVIGKRLQDYPEAKINIEGCNSNTGSEKDNLSLSERRASTVFNYLRDIWSIDPSRMSISKRNLPMEPSNPREQDGIEENRRVEITSNRYEIIAPVMVEDTFRTVNPPVARFYPEVVSDVGVTDWALDASQNNMLVNRFSGTEVLPVFVDWKFENNQNNIPKIELPVEYHLHMNDKDGQYKETEPQILPVDLISVQKKKREHTKDRFIDRYSLILFSFDKSKLSYYNEKLTDYIKSRMSPTSTVSIKGHTDRMGDAAYNLQLSADRAQAVASVFTKYPLTVHGHGESQLMYNNNLPEGRFYSRKVDVVVETPITE